jgi:hypothetical protein
VPRRIEMTSLFRKWAKPKPISAKGTAAALAAGDRMYKKAGVSPALKDIVKLSIQNDNKSKAAA